MIFLCLLLLPMIPSNNIIWCKPLFSTPSTTNISHMANMTNITIQTNITSTNNKTSISIPNKNSIINKTKLEDIDKQFSTSINSNVDPCEDFYEFSCGKWSTEHPLGMRDLELSTFSIVSDKINEQILLLLNGTVSPTKTINIGMIKAMKQYKACMNLEKIELLDVAPMINHLQTLQIPLFGEDERVLQSWDVIQSIINYTKFHTITPLFFDIDVNHDHFNSSKMIIRFDEGSFGLTKELLLNDKKAVNLYKDLIQSVLTLIRPNLKNNYEVTNVAHNIIEFEKKLAQMSMDEFNKSLTNSLRRTTINELRAAVSTVDWLDFIGQVFSNKAAIDGDLTIITINPNYLYGVSNMLQQWPKKEIANYMAWRIIQAKLPLLGCKYRKLYNIYTKQLNEGVSKEDLSLNEVLQKNCNDLENDEASQPRDEYCSNTVNAQFGIAVASSFIDQYLSSYQLDQAKQLIKEVIFALERRIKRYQWIDELTRYKILDKMDNINRKLGFPVYIYNQSYIESRFGDSMLTINEQSFYDNIDQIDRLFRKLSLTKLTAPIWSEKWAMYPQTLNAMYQFFNNEIVIPAGILRQPFFYSTTDDNIPMSLSFGALGTIVGHELTHAIDSTGRKFDKKGNAVKEWWEGESLVEFNKKAVCFLEQYSDYTIYDHRVDGKKTLAENIADNGGINIAYEAYLNYLSKFPTEQQTLLNHKPFSKCNFTNNQLFFISYAQQYCVNNQKKFAQINMLNEAHAPSKLRVIGSLSNMDQFSQAFQCRNNTKMNPPKKCTLW